MEKIYKKISLNYLFLFSVVTIFAIAVSSFFVFPSADDFNYASEILKKNYWDVQVSEYLTWNGRYVATAIITASPLSWGAPHFYFLHSILLIVFFIFSLLFLIKQLYDDSAWKTTIVLSALFFLQMYNLNQGIYWLAGAWTYTFPMVLTNVFIGLLIKHFQTSKVYIVSYVFVFLIIGCNETIMILTTLLLASLTLVTYIENKKVNKYLLTLTIFALICSLFVILAPGNSVRSSHFEKSHRVFRTLFYPIKHIFGYMFIFINITFVIVILKKIKSFKVLVPKVYNKYIYFSIPFIIYMGTLPSYWGMGRGPNYRTRISIQWLVWLCCLFLIPLVYKKSPKIKNLYDSLSSKKIRVLVILGIVLSKNFLFFLKDSSKIFKYYEVRSVEFKKLNNHQISSVFINPIDSNDIPELFVFKDFQKDIPSLKKYYFKKNISLNIDKK